MMASGNGILHRQTLACFFALLPVLCSSCGIEMYQFLAPIDRDDVEFTAAGEGARFYHTLLNDTDAFLGYDLYYRLFAPGDPQKAALRAELEGAFISSSSQLTRKGLRRVAVEGSGVWPGRQPTLPVPLAHRSEALQFHLAFNQERTPPIPPSIEIRRDDGTTVIETLRIHRYGLGTGQFKKFLPGEFEATDSDIANTASSAEVVVLLCVVAYGFEHDNFIPVFSSPVFLVNPFGDLAGGSFAVKKN